MSIKKKDGIKILVSVILLAVLFFMLFSHWEIAPASGKAYGYVYYQEKSGIFQLDVVCWKDTPYVQECEWFDPAGRKYEPGKYTMEYRCSMLVWAWEKPSNCFIINATRLEE